MNNISKFRTIAIITAIILFGAAGFFIWRGQLPTREASIAFSEESQAYQNAKYNFSFQYPKGFSATEIPDQSGTDDKNISVGGESALSFKNKDESGEGTQEIWMIHNGNLYQITAFESESGLVDKVLENWKFRD